MNRIAERADKCKVIAITNHKGGVGKTTTAVSLAAGLTRRGERVLVIDSDPQANFTISVGDTEPQEIEITLKTVYEDIISGSMDDPEKYIRHSEEGFDYIPANLDLAAAEMQLTGCAGKELRLSTYINAVRDMYTVILIDCNPSLGVLTQNAMIAARRVLIPVQAQYLAVKGLEGIIQTVFMVREIFQIVIEFEGILITMVDGRTNNSKYICSSIHEMYGEDIRVFDTSIPMSVRASETAGEGLSIYKYDPQGKVTLAYENLVKEVMSYEE